MSTSRKHALDDTEPLDLAQQLRDGKTPHQIAKEHGWTLSFTFERIHDAKQQAERQLKSRIKPWNNDTR